MSAPFRCGDHVYHRPSRETWVVAYCEGDNLCPEGWPDSIARTADCRLVYAATDAEHRHAVWIWRQAPAARRRGAVLRLYAPPRDRRALILAEVAAQDAYTSGMSIEMLLEHAKDAAICAIYMQSKRHDPADVRSYARRSMAYGLAAIASIDEAKP
jgi:hypothetical protein